MDDILHIAFDCFNVAEYIFSNIAGLFSMLFTPLTGIFNFVKGFTINDIRTISYNYGHLLNMINIFKYQK